jgi:hypothetical protein
MMDGTETDQWMGGNLTVVCRSAHKTDREGIGERGREPERRRKREEEKKKKTFCLKLAFALHWLNPAGAPALRS